MLARLLCLVLLTWSLPVLAAEGTEGPSMGELLKLPVYIYAWQGMMAGETPPEWVKQFTATLDGPPTPSIPVPLDGEIYTLGFTCKPGDCEANQLYVLFAPEGRDAWGLLASPDGITWLGQPADRIQKALLGALRR
ncbi:MAG: Ivy family c-type lysozyme inhibitor [Hyphomicrobiales bacterium]